MMTRKIPIAMIAPTIIGSLDRFRGFIPGSHGGIVIGGLTGNFLAVLCCSGELDAPHPEQKLAPSLISAPHERQNDMRAVLSSGYYNAAIIYPAGKIS